MTENRPAPKPERANASSTGSRGKVLVLVVAVVAALVTALLIALPDRDEGDTGGPAPSAGSSSGPAADESADWQRLSPRLPTRWSADVGPANALPAYPRPQLTRDRWLNLNGVWQFAGAATLDDPPLGRDLPERILVPYPTESALSGIRRHEDVMWYRRTVTVPPGWRIGKDERLRLHFGAVDYATVVYINGDKVADHTGGYDTFAADITDSLTGSGDQEIVVGVEDRADATWQAVGKQRLVPDRGIFYTGYSGIWQTVWMEPVPTTYVDSLDLQTDIDRGRLTVDIDVDSHDDERNLSATVAVKVGGATVATVTSPAEQPLRVRIPKVRLWSPASPYLYDLTVTLTDGRRKAVDRVGSYVGMREIGTAVGEDGRQLVTLNGEAVFLMSTLDQGYWPDGISTAPTDEALAFDLRAHKQLGFNTVRKHIKTEPDRWYYWADRLGLMVWQDMPSMKAYQGEPPLEAQRQFAAELTELVDEKDVWTSIVGWVPFNEGWGEWGRQATGRIADEVAEQDPTRLVNAHSGVNCCDSQGDSGRGDVIDWHEYVGPATPLPTASRVAIDGEHGGFGLEVRDHMWFDSGGAYEMVDTPRQLTDRYVQNQRQVLRAVVRCDLSGAVYTQLTDVEHEVNGFFSYDREVEKMDFARVRAVNRAIIAAARTC